MNGNSRGVGAGRFYLNPWYIGVWNFTVFTLNDLLVATVFTIALIRKFENIAYHTIKSSDE